MSKDIDEATAERVRFLADIKSQIVRVACDIVSDHNYMPSDAFHELLIISDQLEAQMQFELLEGREKTNEISSSC